MKWNKTDKVPQKFAWLVLLCEGGIVLFDGEHNGDEYVLWDDDIEVWRPTEKAVIGWMYQADVKQYLKELPFAK